MFITLQVALAAAAATCILAYRNRQRTLPLMSLVLVYASIPIALLAAQDANLAGLYLASLIVIASVLINVYDLSGYPREYALLLGAGFGIGALLLAGAFISYGGIRH